MKNHPTTRLLVAAYMLTCVGEGTMGKGSATPCHWMLPVATVRPCNN